MRTGFITSSWFRTAAQAGDFVVLHQRCSGIACFVRLISDLIVRSRTNGAGYETSSNQVLRKIFAVCMAAMIVVLGCAFLSPAAAFDLNELPTLDELQDKEQVEKGIEAYQEERYGDAAGIFEAYVSKHPGSSDVYFALGLCHMQLERYVTAVWNLEKSLEGEPNREEAYLGLAKSYLGLEDYEKSAHALEEYVRIRKRVDAEIAFSLAKLYFQLGKLSQAQELFGVLTERSPENADFWFGYAVTMTQMENWPEALVAFEKTAEFNPEQEQIKYYLGIAAYQTGDYERAEPLLEKELENQPESASLLTALGVMAGHRKAYAKAETYVRRAIKAAPDDPRTYINLIAILAQQDKIDEALKESNAALGRWPENEDLLYSNAVLLINKEKMKESSETLEKLVRINPANLDARRLLAALYQHRSRNDEAAEQFKRIIALEPGDTESRKSLAALLKKDGELEEALKHYRFVIKREPSDEDAWRKAALILEKVEDKEELLDLYAKMADALPKSGFAYANLGYMAEEDGDKEKALQYYEKALEREDVGDVGVYVKRAKYYEEEGEKVSAEVMYRRGLEKTLEHSQEVYGELMRDLQQSGGRLDLNKLMEIGEREENLSDSLDDSMEGVMGAFEEREDREGAISYLEGLLEKYPGNKKLIKSIGELEREAGNLDRVKLFSEQLIRADVKDGAGHLWMAWVRESNGDAREAGLSYMRAVEADPENEEACQGLVESYRAQGRLEFLEPFLRRKLEKNTDLPALVEAYKAAADAAGIPADMRPQLPEKKEDTGDTPEDAETEIEEEAGK